KEESNSNQTDNHSSIENENHTEESIQEQKDAEKEETEVLSIVNTLSSTTQTPEDEIQIIDTMEHREAPSLPLTTNPSNINQVSEEAIIHVEGNAKQEESEWSDLVEIDSIHEKDTETQATTPFNDNSNLSNNSDTSLPNSSPSSHDSTSSFTIGSSDTNNLTNSLKNSISDLRKLFPFSYNNQNTDSDTGSHDHDHKIPNRKSNPKLTEPSPVNDFILPSSIEKDPLDDTETKNFAVIPKLDTSTDYLIHPLNDLGYFNNHKKKKSKKEKNSIPEKKKPVNPSPVKKNLDPIEQNYLLEKQYYSLMKHAEFMYNKLRNERLKNKIQD
ncbi:MAG TPA: hypothetical protein VNR61_18410, partial [Niallia sp.]|nr:hypothetical protein [Niallia sp.]